MKNKKGIPFFLLFAVLITIVYIALAAKPLTEEFQFTPIWKINISAPITQTVEKDKKKLAFHLGQSVGYFTEDGEITLLKSFPAKADISDYYFAIYNSGAKNTEFFNNNGEIAGYIKAEGFPYFAEQIIYVFLPGGCSFSKCTQTGDIQWTYEGTIPITAFAANDNHTAAGFADGTIKVLNNADGQTEVNFAPGGSDYPVILGLDISSDGKYVASISGHKKQRFVLSRREGNQQKIIYHKFFENDLPYRTIVRFCKDSRRILYNFPQGLDIYDIEDKKSKFIDIKDKIISVKETDDMIFLLSKEKKKYTVSLVDSTNTLEGSFSFTAESAFINTYDNNLYVGRDNSISRIKVSKE